MPTLFIVFWRFWAPRKRKFPAWWSTDLSPVALGITRKIINGDLLADLRRFISILAKCLVCRYCHEKCRMDLKEDFWKRWKWFDLIWTLKRLWMVLGFVRVSAKRSSSFSFIDNGPWRLYRYRGRQNCVYSPPWIAIQFVRWWERRKLCQLEEEKEKEHINE